MARKLDKILVVDVESTCWEGDPPAGEESEIIEIGYCLLETRSLERTAFGSIMVRPTRSRVGEYCTNLTTLTQEMVDRGTSFKDACKWLEDELDSPSLTFASYGDYDRRQFQKQCAAHGVVYPFGPTHLNVKNLLGLSLGLAHEVGMDMALALLGLPLMGTHHRGGDDAQNIAAVLSALLTGSRIGECVA